MTQPVQKVGIHSQQGWHYLTHKLGRDLPYQLTHGANALRAVLKLTGGR